MAVICVRCKTHMRAERNDVRVFERLDDGKVYKIWSADKLKCSGCGFEVVSGFGLNPLIDSDRNMGEIEACAEAIQARVGDDPADYEIVDWYFKPQEDTHE